MAPYYGPSIVGLLRQLAAGATSVSLGRGVPALEVARDGTAYSIVALGGGAGFGVTPDHDPIIRTGEPERVADLNELVTALAKRWQPGYGPGFEPGEHLELRFASGPEDVKKVQQALRMLGLGIAECHAIAKSGRYVATSFEVLVTIASSDIQITYDVPT
jgi:hypothetical protein